MFFAVHRRPPARETIGRNHIARGLGAALVVNVNHAFIRVLPAVCRRLAALDIEDRSLSTGST